jgi:hypothetical protein
MQLALEEASRWRRRKGVVAIGLGHRQRRGERFLLQQCVVVIVCRKKESARLRPRQLLPDAITVRVDGVDWRVGVDVRCAGGECVVRTQGEVGEAIVAGGLEGALGPFVSDGGPDGLFLVSGHVAAASSRVSLPWGARGTVQDVWMTTELDHALVVPPVTPTPQVSLRPDGRPIRSIAPHLSALQGMAAYAYRPTTRAWVDTSIVDWWEEAWVEPRGGRANRSFMTGLIATDRCSVPGDSGMPLYLDATDELVGTLLGAVGEVSMFLPAETAFRRLGLDLL